MTEQELAARSEKHVDAEVNFPSPSAIAGSQEVRRRQKDEGTYSATAH